MNTVHPQKRPFRAVLLLSLAILWLPHPAQAELQAITPADLRFSEPFEITATIMEIDYGKDLLIVAEREIYVVDFLMGKKAIQTKLSDADGEALLFDALKRGQKVRVSGIQLPDGRLIAAELVLQSDGR
jgi:hypothetical protein